MVLDPSTGAKSEEIVLVSYPNKPMVCSACKSLGHLIGACPTATRKWVRKEKPVEKSLNDNPGAVPPTEVPVMPHPATNSPALKTPVAVAKDTSSSLGSLEDYSDNSAPPPKAFKNLKRIDECSQQPSAEPDFQLTRAQRKRLRRAKGKSTPST